MAWGPLNLGPLQKVGAPKAGNLRATALPRLRPQHPQEADGREVKLAAGTERPEAAGGQ